MRAASLGRVALILLILNEVRGMAVVAMIVTAWIRH